MGVTAGRWAVVAALAGAGFALGYLLAPSHTDPATPRAATKTIAVRPVIRAAAAVLEVPTLITPRHKHVTRSGGAGRATTTGSATGTGPTGEVTTQRSAGTGTTSTPARTRTTTKTPTHTDTSIQPPPFDQHPGTSGQASQ